MKLSQSFNILIKITVPIIVAFFVSCSTEPIILEPESVGDYYAYCTLLTTGSTHQILLGKSVPENKPIDIGNAQVTIFADSERTNFSYMGNGIYQNIKNKLEVKPGRNYHLNIQLPDGKSITGETTVPNEFNILFPAEEDTVEYDVNNQADTLTMPKVSWKASTGALSYQLAFEFVENNNLKISDIPVSTLRTCTFMPELLANDIQDATKQSIVQATLYVAALDSFNLVLPATRLFLPKFYDINPKTFREFNLKYQNELDSESKPSTNLSNAFGLFNSANIQQRKLWLKLKI